MEEQLITIRCFNASTGQYYDKQVPYVYDLEKGKKDKFAELETYIANIKETGTEIDGKWFKCDDECKNNITQSMLFIDSLLPLTWFTRNGEFGVVTFTTKEEFMQFVGAIASKLAEIQNKYYAYKYAIENATSEEELNAIVFGDNEEELPFSDEIED